MLHTRFSICVYCGSRPGRDPAFVETARGLGRAIAENGWRLVYGAGDQGIMGAVAEATEAGGGAMLGVIPLHLVDREAPDGRFGRRVVTETMHERKKIMLMNAHAIVMLPGGAGSLDEFFEALTWAQLGLHDKPIILCNIKGFWDPLHVMIRHVIETGFAEADLFDHIELVPDTPGLVRALSRAAASRE